MTALTSSDNDLEGHDVVIYGKWAQIEGVLEKEDEQT